MTHFDLEWMEKGQDCHLQYDWGYTLELASSLTWKTFFLNRRQKYMSTIKYVGFLLFCLVFCSF